MKHFVLLVLLGSTLTSCQTLWKVVELDPQSHHFPTSERAVTVLNKPLVLVPRRTLLVVPLVERAPSYVQELVKKMNIYTDVINFSELENRLAKNSVTDKVLSVRERIGIHNAAKYYQPFLWIEFSTRQEGDRIFEQIFLTDALTLDEYFRAEVIWDFRFKGISDQTVWYPLMNSLYDYLRSQD